MAAKFGILVLFLYGLLVAETPLGFSRNRMSAVNIDRRALFPGNRRLKGELEETLEFVEEISFELAEMQKAMPMTAEWQAPIIERHCTVIGETPFYTVESSSYPGCFFTCAVIDYCDFFTYEAENATCDLYHTPEVEWTDDAPLFCWGVGPVEGVESKEGIPS